MQVLVAPAGFDGLLRATEVAAAIGRGLEAAGLEAPDLCPVADGGPGTLEVLLTRLGGESVAASVSDPRGHPVDVGFGVLGDGSAAIVELAAIARARAPRDPRRAISAAGRDPRRASAEATSAASSRAIGELVAAGLRTRAEVVFVAAGGCRTGDGGAGAVAAIERAGGRGRSRLVVLCPSRPHLVSGGDGHGGEPGGVGEALTRAFGAVIEPGARFVLDALDFDERMRAARALIVGEGLLDRGALTGRVLGEAATRARQAGIPTHAIVAVNQLDPFDARILDLQMVLEAPTLAALTTAAAALAGRI